MRLIKCRNCGTTIGMDEGILETMYQQLMYLNKKSINSKGNYRNIFIQQSAQLSKMINQIQHHTTEIEKRKETVSMQYGMLVKHIIAKKLMTLEEIKRLEEITEIKSEVKNKHDIAKIKKIYGDFENDMANNTKSDPTSDQAIRGI